MLLYTDYGKWYFPNMEIESITHKGLKRFFTTGSSKGLVGDVRRIQVMMLAISSAHSIEDLSAPPNFGLHPLKGNRTGTWAMTVTRNWRLTFRISENGQITDLNLEDYHGS